MSVRGFLIGVVLALVLTSETVTLVTQCDKGQAGLPTVARWRVQFGVAVILAALAGLLVRGSAHTAVPRSLRMPADAMPEDKLSREQPRDLQAMTRVWWHHR